jgi:hypothetical protein
MTQCRLGTTGDCLRRGLGLPAELLVNRWRPADQLRESPIALPSFNFLEMGSNAPLGSFYERGIHGRDRLVVRHT